MKRLIMVVVLAILVLGISGCVAGTPSDKVQAQQQEQLAQESNSQVGMPAIVNFREKKLLKEIFELRDQEGLVTHTYIFSQFTGKYTYIGQTVGYGIPYATQFTNPQKIVRDSAGAYLGTMPQMDPNALFSPESADGTWILMLDEGTGKVTPQYIEEKISVYTFKLADSMLNK